MSGHGEVHLARKNGLVFHHSSIVKVSYSREQHGRSQTVGVFNEIARCVGHLFFHPGQAGDFGGEPAFHR